MDMKNESGPPMNNDTNVGLLPTCEPNHVIAPCILSAQH